MKPLEALGASSDIPRLLMSSKSGEVEAAIARAEEEVDGGPLRPAGILFARAAWALREGRLETARVGFEDAEREFLAGGDAEAAELARIESAIALARRGRRESALEAEKITALLETSGASPEVRARATLARGTALRVLGDAAGAQTCFTRALGLARDLPDVRSMVLNSLGTLCVSLGAFGAAETLCEHAAELCRIKKDVVGEAIAMGQLGAAALGRGDLVQARRFLSRQEWLSSQIGDPFGRTRALVWLADVSLEAGRADDAAMLATRALESANSVTPPLSTFAAYAERALGRARIALGEPAGRDDIARACATFTSQKLPLGEALSARDLALARDPIDRASALGALTSLASLGLPERIAEVLGALGAPAELELSVASPSGRRLEPLEARLVYERPDALAATAQARSASRKNLSRLAVLALSEPGLWIAAVSTDLDLASSTLVDETRVSCAVIGGWPGLHLLAWSAEMSADAIAADWLLLRSRAGGALTGAVSFAESARVVTAGFGGGLAASSTGVDPRPLLTAVDRARPGEIAIVGTEAPLDALSPALERAGLRPA